ncbi:hypothetical protein FJ881_09485 [Escherichia albertii]|nr:hypothetical protein [Escherichia albertii]
MLRKCSGIGYDSSLSETFFRRFFNAGIVCFVYAGCGVNALSGLQSLPDSIYCLCRPDKRSASGHF